MNNVIVDTSILETFLPARQQANYVFSGMYTDFLINQNFHVSYRFRFLTITTSGQYSFIAF